MTDRDETPLYIHHYFRLSVKCSLLDLKNSPLKTLEHKQAAATYTLVNLRRLATFTIQIHTPISPYDIHSPYPWI